jgi:hypothetical protein
LSWLLIIPLMPDPVESAEDCANNKKLKNENITERLNRLKKYCLIIN